VRLTGAVYLGSFCVVGNPFNFYWGFLTGPLLAVGLAGAPGVLTRLVVGSFSGCLRPVRLTEPVAS
jgi:hypothetical protein